MAESYELGIVGDRAHEHGEWCYYHTALHEFTAEENRGVATSGIYAVCGGCGMHRWNVTPPEGAEVIDIDTLSEDEPEDDEASDA